MPECLSAQVPYVPECPSAQVPFESLSALPSTSSAQLTKCPCARVPQVLNGPSALSAVSAQVPLECLWCVLGVPFECLLSAEVSFG